LLEIDGNLKSKFEDAANAIKSRLQQKPPHTVIRKLITDQTLGHFQRVFKLSPDDLSRLVSRGGVAGVDGSTNTTGGPFPYCLTMQQALAKDCDITKPEITLTDSFSPLTMEEVVREEEYREMVKHKLAELEANVALVALEEYQPSVLLLDGSLVRFKIEAPPLWERLKAKALFQNTIIVGIVEGISTGVISQNLQSYLPATLEEALDWEMLFGLLEVGEVLVMKPGLFKEGFRTCFMRASRDPKPIGIDLLEEQQSHMDDLCSLIFTLTPEDSRGIPLWLDVVDQKVRITDGMMEGLLSTYLGEDYMEYLMPKRNKRQQ